jgi:O-antigen/teichoic acid export membrane protein
VTILQLARRSILHNFSALTSTQVAGRIIRFAYLALIARFLSADEVGLYSYGTAIYLSLLGLGGLGQSTLLAARIGRKRAHFAVTAAHSLTILIVGLVVVAAAGLGFIRLSEPDPAVRQALAWFLLALVARGFATWVRSCYAALERTTWIPRYEFSFRGLEAVTGAAALWLGAGLVTICFLHFAFWAIEAVASFGLLIRDTGFRLRLGTNMRLLRRYMLVSLPIMLGLWLLNLFPQLGIVGLRQIQPDAAQVAHFAIAMQFVTTLFVLPVALSQAMLPALARAHRNRDETDLKALLTVLKLCLVGGALAAAVTAAVGPWVVVAAFGEDYRAAGEAFANMMWGLGPYSAAFIAASALNALNFRTRATVAAFLMVAIQAGGMALLAGPGGLDSVDATVAGFLLASLAGMAWSFRGLATALRLDAGRRRGGWWLAPTGLLLAGSALDLGGWLQPSWVFAAGVTLTLLGSAMLGVFSRPEMAVILGKAGVRRGGLVRWLSKEGSC